MQAVNPRLKGKPVVIGAERGIATAISYEAKVYGIKRGMPMNEIKKLYPEVIVLPGDYELFSLFSKKMFSILRRFSPTVEEYSIDEGFADLCGMRRPLHLTYEQIAQQIQSQVNQELAIPISIGISLTKSLAKLASDFKKPMGITIVSGKNIEKFLAKIPLLEIWGIGQATNRYLAKFNIKDALQFANLPETVFEKGSEIKLNKPHLEIWTELRGLSVYKVNPQAKNQYKSISKTRTFRPATNNPEIVWAELINNVEEAFTKVRRYGYFVKKMVIFLKTQQFRYFSAEINFNQKQQYPLLFRNKVKQTFVKLFKPSFFYRATGCVLVELSENNQEQIGLFNEESLIQPQKVKALYQALEQNRKIDFGSSLWLRNHHHAKEQPKSKSRLPRFNIPMLEI